MAAYAGNEDTATVRPVEALSLALMQATELYLSLFESRRSEKATKELGVTVRHFASCLSERPDRFDEFAMSDDETELESDEFEDDDPDE
ncbi:hypothetical protein A1353_23095 [Methylomonas methanica]|uniref:Uncharacterized protein n=1 Tax=Methylomonas methanica TaxID=421 RepID=A0A177LV64_METMH|nr:hypothetical protein [Methylomonas methanica]OAH97376.1 hypothetical protein A1353_23095 [Methylomonas methanica]